MKQPSREITLVIDRAGWNTRLSEHKCSIAWNMILSLNGTCRGTRTECTGVKMLCTWEARSGHWHQNSPLGFEGRSAVKNQALLDWPKAEPTETCTKNGVSLSTKRVTLLSPTFLKKGMSSPIAKFAHNGITGRSIEPVFALVLVTGMQGRGRSALEWPPSPCSALNECDLCRKNFFSTWIQELCVLSISALCCKVCPLTQGVHCQPQWWIVSPLCVCFLLSKNGDKDISFLSLQNTATVLDGQCIRRLQYHCCCKQCCFFVPKYRRQVFLGGFWVEKKSKTAYLNDNYALLILQITAKMSVFFSSSSLVG